MKKEFIKKLSFAMASALVITSASPLATADAASKMKMNKSSKILYLNDDNMTGTSDTIDLSIKNKPTNYKTKYSFNWYAEDTSIVSVAKGGVVTAKKVGQTTVKCDITKKSNKKLVTTAECVVTVKANAETVTIKNAPENNTMTVGSTFDFNRTMKDANGKKATDKTEWIVSDAEVASVDKNGVVTALKAGTFTLKACTYQSKATKDLGYTAESEEIKITVAPSITNVAQTTATSFDVQFDSDMSKLTASDFEVKNAAGVKQIVKSVSFDATGKKATVSLYIAMTDKVDYTVEAKGVEAYRFTASVGEAASVVVTTTKVSDNEASAISYKILDANGVQLYSGDAQDPDVKAGDSVSFSTGDGAKGYFDGNKLIAYNIGDVVPVTVTYYTGAIDTTTGEPVKIVSEATGVTVVDNAGSTISSVVATTVSDLKLGKNADWSKLNNTVSVTDVNGNNAGASVKYLHVKAIDSSNTTVYTTAYADDKKDAWTFTSADTTKLNIDEVTGELLPVAVGSANVICKNGEFSYVTTVTVGAARTASTVAVNKSSATLSNAVNNSASFEIKIKDNYSADMKLNSATWEQVSAPSKTANLDLALTGFTAGDNKATFTATVNAGDAVETGTYTYKLSVTDAVNYATRSYTVTVKVANAAGSTVSYYKVISGETSKDITINNWNTPAALDAVSFDVKVAGVNNSGVQVTEATGVTYTVTKPNGTKVDLATDANISLAGDKLVVKPYTVSGSSVSKMAAGQYRVEAKVADKTATATVFNIVDNQAKAVVDLKNTTLTINTGDNLVDAIIREKLITSEQGTIATISEINISSAAGYDKATGTISNVGTYNVTLKKVQVNYEIKNNDDVVVATTPQEIAEAYTIRVTVQ